MPYQPPDYLGDRPRIPSPDQVMDLYLGFREERGHPTTGDMPWRASSLGTCIRAQALRRLGVAATRPLDAKTLRTFEWGHEIGRWVADMYDRCGLLVAAEPHLADPALDVVGHADIIASALPAPGSGLRADMRFALDGYEQIVFGIELKSANSKAMEFRFADGPQIEHRCQAGIYKHMASVTPMDANPDIDFPLRMVERWFLTYIGKDWGGMLTYEVEDAWVDEALTRLGRMNGFWQGGVLAPCECPNLYGGRGPAYCDYAEGGGNCCGRQAGVVATLANEAMEGALRG